MPCRSVAHWIDQVSDPGRGDAPMKVGVKAVDHAPDLAPREGPWLRAKRVRCCHRAGDGTVLSLSLGPVL
jgi:hypothetical protein